MKNLPWRCFFLCSLFQFRLQSQLNRFYLRRKKKLMPTKNLKWIQLSLLFSFFGKWIKCICHTLVASNCSNDRNKRFLIFVSIGIDYSHFGRNSQMNDCDKLADTRLFCYLNVNIFFNRLHNMFNIAAIWL